MTLPAFIAIGFMFLVTINDYHTWSEKNYPAQNAELFTGFLAGILLLLLWWGGIFE